MVRFYRIAVIANKTNSLICEIHPPKKACCALLTRNDNFTPSVSLKPVVHSKKLCCCSFWFLCLRANAISRKKFLTINFFAEEKMDQRSS